MTEKIIKNNIATELKNNKIGKIGRPYKARIIGEKPRTVQFSPRGHAGRPGYIVLKLEELEAIKLSDYMRLKQCEAAKSMNISQQTFSRILNGGRKILARALINGEIIKIQGGNFKFHNDLSYDDKKKGLL